MFLSGIKVTFLETTSMTVTWKAYINAAILLIEYLIVDMTNKKIIFYTKKCHHEL